MKKKIKDLTLEDLKKFCSIDDDSCEGCPLQKLDECYEIFHYQKLIKKLKELEATIPLEQEIEVNEDE
jgi:hypothetical protein